MSGKFSIDLSRLIKNAQSSAEIVTRKIMLEAFTGVVMKTPVDTGRARGNWFVGYGAPNTSVDGAEDKSGASSIARAVAGVQSARIGSGSVFMTNALPYSIRLENGYSKQAPVGMVGVTMANISRKYGS